MVLGRVHPPPSHLILLSQFQTAAGEDDDHERHSKMREPFAACHVLYEDFGTGSTNPKLTLLWCQNWPASWKAKLEVNVNKISSCSSECTVSSQLHMPCMGACSSVPTVSVVHQWGWEAWKLWWHGRGGFCCCQQPSHRRPMPAFLGHFQKALCPGLCLSLIWLAGRQFLHPCHCLSAS